jgi:hypothetical protein
MCHRQYADRASVCPSYIGRISNTVILGTRLYVLISKYITGTDRRSVRGQTVFALTCLYNTVYLVKYHFSALILALCRARVITIPTIHYTSSYLSNEDVSMVGIVITRARHSAKIRAKSLIVSEKN